MMQQLEIRLARVQTDLKAGRRLLRHVRLLYIQMVHIAVLTDPTNGSINRAAYRMIEAGMYAEPASPRNVRYAILKRCWTITTGRHVWHLWQHDNWHAWLKWSGYTSSGFLRPEPEAKSA